MTFVGKILVIIIMACSLLFLGISTVVFTTATDWRAKTAAEQTKVTELQKKHSDAQAAIELSKKELATATAQHEAAKKQLLDQIAVLEGDKERALAEMTEARKALEIAAQTARTSLDQALALRNETTQLREQKSAVEKQANEYKLRQTELNDRIRELSRMLETATNNAKDLRERVARLTSVVRGAGLSENVGPNTGPESAPPVQGEIARVDAQNRRFEITIGSDDGLQVGHQLYLYRTKPNAEYLGKATVITTDPDRAVIRVIGSTVQNKRVKEGDIVSSTIRPRG
jgi:hypothetical protein